MIEVTFFFIFLPPFEIFYHKKGEKEKNPISLLGKYKIMDNIVRMFLHPALLIILLCAVILDNVSMTNLYSYFDTFIEYSVHPSEVYEIELNEETKIVLPANINYILIPTEDDYTEKFNKTLAKGSISIEVIIGKAKEGRIRKKQT